MNRPVKVPFVTLFKQNSKRIQLKQIDALIDPATLPPNKLPLDPSYNYPYKIQMVRLEHLPVSEFQTCNQINLNFSFFDKGQAMFFGNTFTRPLQDKLMNSSMASISLQDDNKYSCNMDKEVCFLILLYIVTDDPCRTFTFTQILQTRISLLLLKSQHYART